MIAVSLYSFPARMDSLGAVLAHIREASFCAEPAAALRAETAVEELLTNSVVYGAAGQATQASIWLGVTANGAALKLRYEDAFAAFDPLPKIVDALHKTSDPMDQRPVGGLGLLMVYRLADEFHYVRENGRNCISLSFLGRRVS